ncbi:hypothetical protein BR93DRAFT_964052 [Coniochaeta sp. PMI_546]|nr:hypothetical protein BR93DRAFT_964052 [Coniochaeta sp. PMI_546]
MAILLSLFMTVVGIRALGEADWSPQITLVSQLVFATLVPFLNPNVLIVNLVSAALAAAEANLILGYIVGSVFRAVASCSVYRLYTSSYPGLGPLIGVPAAYISVDLAKPVLGQGLPDGTVPFVLLFVAVFVISST